MSAIQTPAEELAAQQAAATAKKVAGLEAQKQSMIDRQAQSVIQGQLVVESAIRQYESEKARGKKFVSRKQIWTAQKRLASYKSGAAFTPALKAIDKEIAFARVETKLRAAEKERVAKAMAAIAPSPFQVQPASVRKKVAPMTKRVRQLQYNLRISGGGQKAFEQQQRINTLNIQIAQTISSFGAQFKQTLEGRAAAARATSKQQAQSTAIKQQEARALGTLTGTAQKGTTLVIGSQAATLAKAKKAGIKADPIKGTTGVAYGITLQETLKVSSAIDTKKIVGNIQGGLDYKVSLKDAASIAEPVKVSKPSLSALQPVKEIPKEDILKTDFQVSVGSSEVISQITLKPKVDAVTQAKELKKQGLVSVSIPTMSGESFLALAPTKKDFKTPTEPLKSPIRKEIVATLQSIGLDITPKPPVQGPRQPDFWRDVREGIYEGGIKPLAAIALTPRPIFSDISGGKIGLEPGEAGYISGVVEKAIKPGPTLLGSTIEQVASGQPLTGTGRGIGYDIGSAAFDIGTILTPLKKIPIPVSAIKFGSTRVLVATGAGKISAIATISKTGKVTRGFDVKAIGKEGFKDIAKATEERAAAGTELDALGVKQVKLLVSDKGLAKLTAAKIFSPESIDLIKAARVGVETAKKLPKKYSFRDLGDQPFKDLTVAETKVVKAFFKAKKLVLEGSAVDIATIKNVKSITKAADFDIHVKNVKQAKQLTTELVSELNKVAGTGRKFVSKGTKIDLYETGPINFGAFKGQPLKTKFLPKAIGEFAETPTTVSKVPKSLLSGSVEGLQFHHITKGISGKGVVLTEAEHAGITALQGQLGKIKVPKGSQRVLDVMGERSGTLSTKAEQRIATLSVKEKAEFSSILRQASKQVEDVTLKKKISKIGEFLSPDDPTAGGQVAKTGTVFGIKTPKVKQVIEGIKMRTGVFQIHRRSASVTSIQTKAGKLYIGPPANIPGTGPARAKDFPRLWASLKTGASIFREKGGAKNYARATQLEQSAKVVRREGEKVINFDQYFKANPIKTTLSQAEKTSVLGGVTRFADEPGLLMSLYKIKPTKETTKTKPTVNIIKNISGGKPKPSPKTDINIIENISGGKPKLSPISKAEKSLLSRTKFEKLELAPGWEREAELSSLYKQARKSGLSKSQSNLFALSADRFAYDTKLFAKSLSKTKKGIPSTKPKLDTSPSSPLTTQARTLPYLSGYKKAPDISYRPSTSGKSPYSSAVTKTAKDLYTSPRVPKVTRDISPSLIRKVKDTSPTSSPTSRLTDISSPVISPRRVDMLGSITGSPRPSPSRAGSPSSLTGSPSSLTGSPTSWTGSPTPSPRRIGSPASRTPGGPGSPGSPGSPGRPGSPRGGPGVSAVSFGSLSLSYREPTAPRKPVLGVVALRSREPRPKYRPVKPGADYIGNVPVDKIVGVYGRSTTIYGKIKTAKLEEADIISTKRKYKSITSRKGRGLLGASTPTGTKLEEQIRIGRKSSQPSGRLLGLKPRSL